MNKEWHELNKMPQRAKPQERLAWHLEHQRQCACRPIPASLQPLMEQQGVGGIASSAGGAVD